MEKTIKKISIIHLIIFVTITLQSCKQHDNFNQKTRTDINKNREDTFNAPTKIYFTTKDGKDFDPDTLNKNFDKEQWKKDAKIYLNAKEGEIITVEPTKKKSHNNSKEHKLQTKKYSEPNEDFEYSEYWRKEAFKATKKYLIEEISSSNCKVIGQGLFQPNLIQYIGRRGYLIKILCTYDCNKNYINEAYFWVETYYSGNNNWRFQIIKQKYND